MGNMSRVALVIGFGVSGRGAAKLLLNQGYKVIAVDTKVFHSLNGHSLNGHSLNEIVILPETATIGPVDLTVLSPGIPQTHPQVIGRKTVIGEAELALRHLNQFTIGITGTNGKTTLTLFLTHLFQRAGMKARSLGNVGNSLAEYACAPDPKERLIVELSSYQLETMTTKGFDYGVITTISPDHLDRYESFESYKQAKYRLKDLVKEEKMFYADSYLQVMQKERYLPLQKSPVFYVAWMIAKTLGISRDMFIEGLNTFIPPPHRLQKVKELGGVTFINDSKGTNSGAVLYALSQIQGSVLLIAGGKGKKETFEVWQEPFRNKVRRVFAIGEIASQLQETLDNVIICHELKNAIRDAYTFAQRGETILFSPGAASFDQFRNYEERGNAFVKYVNQLEEKI